MLTTSSSNTQRPPAAVNREEEIKHSGERQDEPLETSSEADLAFTQDVSGRYLSFYWRDADRYQIQPTQLIGQPMGDRFAPTVLAPYLARVQYALRHSIPQQIRYPFRCAEDYLVFDLTLSPVLRMQGASQAIVAIGQFLHSVSKSEALALIDQLQYPPSLPNPDHCRELLTQVAREARHTLDLNAIWQKTVDGLSEVLGLSRCLMCVYKPKDTHAKVVSEFYQSDLESMLSWEFPIVDGSSVAEVLDMHQPQVISLAEMGLEDQSGSLMAIATYYKQQANGLILLHHTNPAWVWTDIEISLIRELADQIGTDIAHATLFAESQNLAAELQQANQRLRQKHQELEEAHKQAEEASRLKSEFLANTSHELRTPLNGMIGFLKLVMDGMADDPEEQNEFISEAHRSAVHLLNIINDILDIAKIEAGKMQLDLDPVNLDDLMLDVENFTRTQAQQRALSLEIRTPAIRDPVILYGNYQRLLQVMLNLVGNALKFTPEGGITITAEVLPDKVMTVNGQERPGTVKISVADTGIGVSLEKQDKLFQNFSQIDGSRTRQYGGTGLGLAISQKLIEAMGGVVNFFSLGEGLGSTVTFTVPLFQNPIMISSEPAIAGEPHNAADVA